MALALSDFISAEELQQVRTDINDNLSELENALLRLEDQPDDPDLVNRVFRAMHTIKGVSGMFGLTRIAALTHHVEDVYDGVRKGKFPLSPDLISATLVAKDQIEALLNQESGTVEEGALQQTEAVFHDLLHGHKTHATPCPTAPAAVAAAQEKLYWIRFRFSPTERIFHRATNPLLYLQGLRQLGECRITCHYQEMPNLQTMDPGVCYLYWEVALITLRDAPTIREEFLFIEDDLSELTIRQATENLQGGDWRLGTILLERGDIGTERLDQFLQQQKAQQELQPLGTLLRESGELPKAHLKSALDAQTMVRQRREENCRKEENTCIRVASSKLDQLVNQVGELVIAQARLKQLASSLKHEHGLQTVAEEITLLAEGLRDSTMSIRLLPIETLFQKFNRLVRDLSRELGKQVRFVTEGGETELDKTVIEHINDPLVHLLRNSVDHGVESPGERQQTGKSAAGMVRLSASHAGASVLIRIEDDGRGMDPALILAKAKERGIVRPETELTEKEIFNLIFLPGFSTKSEVTSVSGRGVGMDVVKRNIESMRGSIQVESRAGQGSVITVKLPLTLAIIDGFLVQVGEERYVIPLSAVRECVRLTSREITHAHGRHIIKIRNEIVPYIRLRELFALEGAPPVKEQIVVTEIDQTRIGLAVDQVLGQNQVVIKSLGLLFNSVPYFSGTTILGDGEVAPILDVAGILEKSTLLSAKT